MEESFQVCVSSEDACNELVATKLYNVREEHTFESLFYELTEGYFIGTIKCENDKIASDESDSSKSVSNKIGSHNSNNSQNSHSPQLSQLTDSNVSESQNGLNELNGLISHSMIKSIKCKCLNYNNVSCQVPLECNVLTICKRHNFLKICYFIEFKLPIHSPIVNDNQDNKSVKNGMNGKNGKDGQFGKAKRSKSFRSSTSDYKNRFMKISSHMRKSSAGHAADKKKLHQMSNNNNHNAKRRLNLMDEAMTRKKKENEKEKGKEKENSKENENGQLKLVASSKESTQSSKSIYTGNSKISLHRQYKQFSNRASLLTLLLSLSEFNSLYFIFLAGFGVFFLSILIDDALKKGDIYNSFDLLKWNFGPYNLSFKIWILLYLYQYIIVLIFYCWRHQLLFFNILHKLEMKFPLPKKKYIDFSYDFWYLFFYIIYICPLLYYPPKYVIMHNHPCATSLLIACEQCRYLMKSHAFFVETFKTKRYWDKCKKEKENENENEKENVKSKYDNIDVKEIGWIVNIDLGLSDQIAIFTYFLFCPTLVYRTKYPRLSHIRWNFVFSCIRDVLLTIFAVWVLLSRFSIPVYRESVCKPGTISNLISEMINGALPGIMLLLLGFFGFLHTWLNLFGELLRFGDRQYYLDWWNARSFGQYYRRWNCVVHDWIYNYIYLALIEHIVGYNRRTIAMLCVFGISAIIHEYILCLAFKFTYPVLLIMFGCIGVLFVPFTKLFMKNAKGWNMFLWTNLLIGQGMLLVLYSREWYAMNAAYWDNDNVYCPIITHGQLQNDNYNDINYDELMQFNSNSRLYIKDIIDHDSILPASWQLFLLGNGWMKEPKNGKIVGKNGYIGWIPNALQNTLSKHDRECENPLSHYNATC